MHDTLYGSGRLGIAVALATVMACGEVPSAQNRGQTAAAEFTLQADSVGALQLPGCNDPDCQAKDLPNPLACASVHVVISCNGTMNGECVKADGSTEAIQKFSHAGLFGCLIREQSQIVECVDAFLETTFAVDADGNITPAAPGATVAAGEQVIKVTPAKGDGSDDIADATPPTIGSDSGKAPTASATPSSDCVATAKEIYAEKLNTLLQQAGLSVRFVPGSWSQVRTEVPRYSALAWEQWLCGAPDKVRPERTGGAPVVPPSPNPAELPPVAPAPITQDSSTSSGKLTLYSAADRGQAITPQTLVDDRPLCRGTGESFKGTALEGTVVQCRCSVINETISNQLLCDAPPQCDAATWGSALYEVQAEASRWLSQEAMDVASLIYERSHHQTHDGFNASAGDMPASGDEMLGDAMLLQCVGSPLVLDLGGDGLALSSVADGVRFDLSGQGIVQTAWVGGKDDALLAIDRNRNGMIDGGTELFGEAETLSGVRGRDGFRALATLDQVAFGGNGDGRVDASDRRFEQLVLWSDANRDGVSQSSELRSLASAGVATLPLECARAGSVHDTFGNDLSLQGSFLRADGSRGTMIDVYFVTHAAAPLE